MQILWSVLLLAGLGALFGLGLAYASKVFHVEEDTRVSDIVEILPNANCGACGYPGCQGYANAIVKGEANSLDLCKPGLRSGVPAKLKEYLAEHPADNGKTY